MNEQENWFHIITYLIAGIVGASQQLIGFLIILMLIDTTLALIKVAILNQKFTIKKFVWKFSSKFSVFLIPLIVTILFKVVNEISPIKSENLDVSIIMDVCIAIFCLAQGLSALRHIKSIKNKKEEPIKLDLITAFITYIERITYNIGKKIMKKLGKFGGCLDAIEEENDKEDGN